MADAFFEKMIINASCDCARRGSPYFTHFLTEEEQQTARFLKLADGVKRVFFGGVGNDEPIRCIMGLFPYEFSDLTDEMLYEMFPLKGLTFSFRKSDELSHRDVLGSLMSLGFERNVIGDIFAGEGYAIVFAENNAYKVINETVTKIGRVGVKLSEDIDKNLLVREFEELDFSVASLRIDCIVPCVARTGRNAAAEKYIKAQKVFINSVLCTDLSKRVEIGDRITVRGCGKFMLSELTGTGRKGNLHIRIKKYK